MTPQEAQDLNAGLPEHYAAADFTPAEFNQDDIAAMQLLDENSKFWGTLKLALPIIAALSKSWWMPAKIKNVLKELVAILQVVLPG